jgi:uncharacterized protein YbaR (Trm112 family)
LYYYQKQAQMQNVPAQLFDKPPTIYFKPDQQVCPVCKRQLHVLKTTTRLIKMLGIGQFTAHHTFLYCPHHPDREPWESTELHKLVPQDANVAYNVIVEIGKLRFFKNRQVAEIKLILDEKYTVTLSTSEIERLINSFIFYLAAIHQENKDLIKAYIDSQGGYILHLDATCEADSPKLVSSIDSLSGFVLYSAKLKSENKDDMITFLKEIKKSFGIPHAVMSDMSKGIKAAVEDVFGDIPHFICHFHFLSMVGQLLFDKENTSLRNALSKAGISGNLKAMRRKLAQTCNTVSRHEIENFLKEPEKMVRTLKAPEICLYYLLLWILDHGSSGNGYGFPFDQQYLAFYKRLNTACSIIENIWPLYSVNNKSFKAIRKLCHLIKEVIDNPSLRKIVERYEAKVSVFSDLRKAFGTTPDSVNNGLTHMQQTTTVHEVEQIKESVEKFITNLKEKISSAHDKQIVDSYRKAIARIEEYGKRLFVDPLVVMVKGEKKVFFIHRTNNIMEHHFRKLNYSYRRVHGNHSVRRNLENIPEQFPLVVNLKNPNYRKLLFDDERKIIEKFAEIDAKIIREMRLKHKSEEKIYASRKIKKVIRLPNFKEQLIEAFASVAS